VRGNTPLLTVAAYSYRQDTISFLIDRGADVYAVNAIGEMPLKKALADNMIDYYYANAEASLKKAFSWNVQA
jgi:ankyrin repeat protein